MGLLRRAIKPLASTDAGNLIDDGALQYIYDAWNRLVKVRSAEDTDVTIQTAEFDGTGRRMKKVVSNAGDLDSTTVYLYDGWKICETRNGSGDVVQQFIHGTQYIDELVMVRVMDKGDLYIHQDANWNVIGLTDLAGNLVERYVYTPYGEITVHQQTSFGDRDSDGDFDSDDKGTPGTTCTGTVSAECRVLDLDFDGDYDTDDAEPFDELPQGSPGIQDSHPPPLTNPSDTRDYCSKRKLEVIRIEIGSSIQTRRGLLKGMTFKAQLAFGRLSYIGMGSTYMRICGGIQLGLSIQLGYTPCSCAFPTLGLAADGEAMSSVATQQKHAMRIFARAMGATAR